jgi:hypothetical protein
LDGRKIKGQLAPIQLAQRLPGSRVLRQEEVIAAQLLDEGTSGIAVDKLK